MDHRQTFRKTVNVARAHAAFPSVKRKAPYASESDVAPRNGVIDFENPATPSARTRIFTRSSFCVRMHSVSGEFEGGGEGEGVNQCLRELVAEYRTALATAIGGPTLVGARCSG